MVLITNQDNTILIVIYRRGLKENIKDKLIRFRGVINTLDNLIENAIEINNKLFKYTIEKYYNGGISREGYSIFFIKSKSYRLSYKEYNLYKYILIELNFTQKKSKKGYNKGRKQYRGKKVITYYSYSKLGYIAKDYRSKNIVYRPQLNILELYCVGYSRTSQYDYVRLSLLGAWQQKLYSVLVYIGATYIYRSHVYRLQLHFLVRLRTSYPTRGLVLEAILKYPIYIRASSSLAQLSQLITTYIIYSIPAT